MTLLDYLQKTIDPTPRLDEIKREWNRIIPTLEVKRLELIQRLALEYAQSFVPPLSNWDAKTEAECLQWDLDFESLTDDEKLIYHIFMNVIPQNESDWNVYELMKEAIDQARGQLPLFECVANSDKLREVEQ